MALVFAESFNSYTSITQVLNRWFQALGGSNQDAFTPGPAGGTARAYRLSGNSQQPSARSMTLLKNNTGAFRFGFYFFLQSRAVALQSTTYFAVSGLLNAQTSGAYTQMYFAVNGHGQVGAGLGVSSETQVWSTRQAIPYGAWSWVEVLVETNRTQVFVNGILRATANGATAITSYLTFKAGSSISGYPSDSAQFSNLVVYDTQGSTFNAGPYGPMFVELKVPSGEGSSTQWTPVNPAVPNWDNVNEAGWGSGAGVESTVDGQKDLYTIQPLTWSPYRVFGVQALYQAMDSNSGGSSIIPVISLPTGEVALPAQQLPVVSPEIFQITVAESAPGVPLTVADINSMQLGITSVIP